MRRLIHIVAGIALLVSSAACTGRGDRKDRSNARAMFAEISALINNYTGKVAAASDSAVWAEVCTQFEDGLEKINFSYPANTDLLLSEGQNDTINNLMQAYIKARNERIVSIMHPTEPVDSAAMDSVVPAVPVKVSSSQRKAVPSARHSAPTGERSDSSGSRGN